MEHVWILMGHFVQQLGCQACVAAIGNAHFYYQAQVRASKRPIDQITRDELFVGDNEFFAIPIEDGCCSNTNFGNGSSDISNRDRITNTCRTFEE